jgi:hypothetical protein
MLSGWCRPCISWGAFDGPSFDVETLATTVDSGDPMMSKAETTLTLSFMTQAINSGSVDNNIPQNPNNPEENDVIYGLNSTNTNDTTSANFKIVEGGDNPYKIEYFERQLFQQVPSESRRNVVLNALRELGVKAYIVDELAVKNTSDVIQHVHHIIRSIEQDTTTAIASSTLGPQRCLLYQDQQSRLFNLVLSSNSEGPKRRWEEYHESFSTLRAISALVLLLRSFPGLFLSKYVFSVVAFRKNSTIVCA